MPYEFRFRRRVEFSETDMAGIMHFSNYFRFMESAEHAFFRSLGHSIVPKDGDAKVGWPRVHAECDYRRPLRFEDEVEVRLLVEEKSQKTIRYRFVFSKVNGGAPEEVARGALVVACVAHAADGSMRAVPVPDAIGKKIEVAPPDVLKNS